jgi:hypothetical protein
VAQGIWFNPHKLEERPWYLDARQGGSLLPARRLECSFIVGLETLTVSAHFAEVQPAPKPSRSLGWKTATTASPRRNTLSLPFLPLRWTAGERVSRRWLPLFATRPFCFHRAT